MAKETTIDVNGNPIPVLQFDHPAQEIDNAVEMVKSHAIRHAANGPDPITPSAIGAAPVGLVSGTIQAATMEELDAALESAFAAMPDGSVKLIHLTLTANTDFFLGTNYLAVIWRRYGKYGVVETISYSQPAQAKRILYNGTWYPWEWDNPPMVPGVEYRTMKRCNGKPVYAKRIDVGVVYDGQTILDVVVYGCAIINYSVQAVLGNGNHAVLPRFGGEQKNLADVNAIYVEQINTSFRVRCGTNESNKASLTIDVEYYKTTD